MRRVGASLALICLCAYVQHSHAFGLLSAVTTVPAHKTNSISAGLAKIAPGRRRPATGGALGLSAGVDCVVDYKYGKRPQKAETTKCACGSGLTYSKCCETWHDRGEAVDPLVLVKSRYSAYAYCLPEYIMRTTHPKSPDFNADAKEWEVELLDFCNSYEFTDVKKKLGLVIEECKFSNDNNAQLLFKALMLSKRDSTANKLVELWEKSILVRDNSAWMYQKGTLEEYSGPLV